MKELIKLFEGTELSEDVKAKISAIFETELKAREAAIEATLTEQYETASAGYSDYLIKEYEEKVEKYLKEEVIPYVAKYVDFATKEFVTENTPAIQSETKVALAEKFLGSLTEATTAFNVVIPESGDDAVKLAEGKLETMTARFDEQMKINETLQSSIIAKDKSKVVDAVCEGLTEKDKEKMTEVSENVKYIDDAQFTTALSDLKESYFPADGSTGKIDEKVAPKTSLNENDGSYLGTLLSQI